MIKTFYTSMLSFVALLVCAVPASAQVSFTVVGNPDQVTVTDQASGYASIPVSPEGSVYSSETNFVYARVSPKENCIIKHAWFENAEGVKLGGTEVYDRTKAFTVNIMASTGNGGTLYIESESLGDEAPSITVNITGDAAKVGMSFLERQVSGLHEGTNVVEYSNSENYVNFHALGGAKFYRFKVNGVERQPSVDTGENSGITYNYLLSVVRGMVIDIETEFPEGPFNITVGATEGCEDFIQTVTIDKTAVTDWADGFQVKGGKTVSVAGDRFNFLVNACMINGDETAYPSFSMSSIIEEDTYFFFDVERIERPLSYVYYAAPGITTTIRTDLGSILNLPEGYTVDVPLCEADNPVDLFSEIANEKESTKRFLYVNDELIASAFYDWVFSIADGDVVKQYAGTEEPERVDVSFVVADGFEILPVLMVDYIKTASVEDEHSVLPGTHFSVVPVVGSDIDSVTVNGEEVQPDADGCYPFVADAATTVEIVGGTSGIGSITTDAEADAPVYNLQGIRVATTSTLGTLPAGIYLTPAGKVSVR